MKLKNLVSKPQLIELKITDSKIVEKYGEEITFHTWDRQPMNVFVKMASVTDIADRAALVELTKDLILDEDGTPAMQGDEILPVDVLMAAVMEVTAFLGK